MGLAAAKAHFGMSQRALKSTAHPGDRQTRVFAVVSTWPELKNAEFEVVERIRAAARNLGCTALTIDNDGYVLDSTRTADPIVGTRVTRDVCDFVISLHFQSPRLYDIYSYIALWNPPEFLHPFGYESSAANMASHLDVLSCESDVADRHAVNLFSGLARELQEPFPLLFHSLPEPFLAPNIGPSAKLFYIGMNWERISGFRGRHHELLERLDQEDLVNIYGPARLGGVEPWAGFQTYKGEIPFDGRSVLTKLNQSGICLALSSKAHQESGIMSNRLFEGIAAGAAIICNPHPIVEKHFKDCVYEVDDRGTEAELTKAITSIVSDIRADPAEALRRTKLAQQRLVGHFSLDRSLGEVLASHPGRLAAYRERYHGEQAKVAAFILYDHGDLTRLPNLVANATRQVDVLIDLTLVCSGLSSAYKEQLETIRQGALAAAVIRNFDVVDASGAGGISERPRGAVLSELLGTMDADFFALMGTDEEWFSDHLATLAESCRRREPRAMAAASGKIIEDVVGGDRRRRRLVALGFPEEALSRASHLGDCGRVLYRKEVADRLPRSLLPLLRSCEANAIGLWATLEEPLALSGQATFVSHQEVALTQLPRVPPPVEEVALVRDSVRGDRRWVERTLRSNQSEAVLRPALPAGLETIYPLKLGHVGLSFLAGGFLEPEVEFVRLDGQIGRMEFALPSGLGSGQLRLGVSGRPDHMAALTVTANGVVLADRMSLRDDNVHWVVGALPAVAGPMAGVMAVVIQATPATRLQNPEGQVLDPHYHSIKVHYLGVSAKAGLLLSPGKVYHFQKGGSALPSLRVGFSMPEEHHVWMEGHSAALEFRVWGSGEPSYLVLSVEGRSAAETTQSCEVWVDGKLAINRSLDAQRTEIVIPVGSVSSGVEVPLWIGLKVEHADQVVDAAGVVVDPRHLGLKLLAAALVASPKEALQAFPEAIVPRRRLRRLVGRSVALLRGR